MLAAQPGTKESVMTSTSKVQNTQKIESSAPVANSSTGLFEWASDCFASFFGRASSQRARETPNAVEGAAPTLNK